MQLTSLKKEQHEVSRLPERRLKRFPFTLIFISELVFLRLADRAAGYLGQPVPYKMYLELISF